MTNKEAIAILTHNWKYRELIDNSYQYEALDLAIKALHIVVDIEANFKRHSNFMMDSDDWDGIKTFAEKVCKGEFDDESD